MISTVLYFFGFFLIACGIASVLLIGLKAKTALASGGMSGLFSIFIAWQVSAGGMWAPVAGIVLAALLFIVFCWRSAKTLFKIFELIPASHSDLNSKGIAFLIISLMAVVSIVVLILQVANY
jgi:hypothetical protein